MNNIFELILNKLHEPHWNGFISPDRPVKWGQLRRLLEELKKDEDVRADEQAHQDEIRYNLLDPNS